MERNSRKINGIKFKYHSYEGYISFGEWLIVQKYIFQLKIKRVLRAGKRILRYELKLFPFIIGLIVFEACIILYGIRIEKYVSIIDGIWDIKVLIFTSILVPGIIGAFTSEYKRHIALKHQYEVYYTFMCESEWFIDFLCKKNGVGLSEPWMMFLYEKNYHSFLEDVSNGRVNDGNLSPYMFRYAEIYETDGISYIKLVIYRYEMAISSLKEAINKEEFIGDYRETLNRINTLLSEIEKEMIIHIMSDKEYDDEQLNKFIRDISGTIYLVIASIRHPWRWDMLINEKIDNIVENSMKEQNVNGDNSPKKGRHKSYIPNIIVLVICVFIFGVTIAAIIFSIISKTEWKVDNIQLILGVTSGVSLIGILASIFDFVGIKRINKYLNSPDYGLDYEKEKECYKYVGAKRKKLKYEAVSYSRYTEWKDHIMTEFGILEDNEDFYRFVVRLLRKKRFFKECILALVIPIEIAFVPMFFSVGDKISGAGIVACLILMLFMTVFFTYELMNVQDDINFLTDFCEILFPCKNKEKGED